MLVRDVALRGTTMNSGAFSVFEVYNLGGGDGFRRLGWLTSRAGVGEICVAATLAVFAFGVREGASAARNAGYRREYICMAVSGKVEHLHRGLFRELNLKRRHNGILLGCTQTRTRSR